MSNEQLLAELARLKAENAKLIAAQPKRTLTLKVSEKGALSIYGMGKFPITLYPEQWLTVFGLTEQIKSFIADKAPDFAAKQALNADAENKRLSRGVS